MTENRKTKTWFAAYNKKMAEVLELRKDARGYIIRDLMLVSANMSLHVEMGRLREENAALKRLVAFYKLLHRTGTQWVTCSTGRVEGDLMKELRTGKKSTKSGKVLTPREKKK
jgi:hypothetical protein